MVVPVATHTEAPFSSLADFTPSFLGTISPWPSTYMMPTNDRPMALSRLMVHVVVRESTSTSPDCSAVKRSLAVSGLKETFEASPNTAAATARQKSTSRPDQLPLSSGKAKPGVPVPTPQLIMPRPLTVASVLACALAAPAATDRAAAAARATLQDWFHLRTLSLVSLQTRIVADASASG